MSRLLVKNNQIFIYLLLFIIATLGLLVFSKKSASAIINLSPDPSGLIPAHIENYLINADSYTQTPAFGQWNSPSGNPAGTSITVPYGATSIDLNYNQAAAVGFQGFNHVLLSGHRVVNDTSSGGTTSGIVGTQRLLDFRPTANDVGTYRSNTTPYTYTPTSPFTSSGVYNITLGVRTVNFFANGDWRCVGGLEQLTNAIDWVNICGVSNVSFNVYITVLPKPIEPPTCSVTNLAASFRAGLGANMTRVSVTNNDSIEAISIDSTSVTVGGSTSSGGTGSIANSSSRTFNQSSNTTVDTPGTHTATWSVDWSSGTQSGTITCSSNVSITVEPISCTSIGPNPIDANVPFRPTLTISNPNHISIPVTGTWTINGATPASGSGSGTIPAGPSSSGTIPSSITTSVPGSGTYQITWTVSTAYAGSNPTDMADCEGVTTALDKPYTRFYGNDVITDGGIGASCPDGIKLPDGAPVVSNGLYNSSTQSHATYQGSASELAIFATGQITGVLPGSQLTSRSPLWELSIANDPILSKSKNPGNYEFGGGYGAEQCVAEFPDTTGFSPPGSGAVPATSGNTAFTGDIEITGGNFGIIQRSTFVIEGNVTISDNITYDTSTPWNDIDEIPLFRLYVSGNIYIDGNVDRLDGLYVAGQTIYTCTNGSSLYSTDKEIVDNCNRKLTVNGAFTSDKVELQRIIGTIGSSNPGESSNEPHIAESFVFSPELYLALLSESKNNFHGTNFDSIISLPPAF